jgi:predicted membrane-bound spermidine synthase
LAESDLIYTESIMCRGVDDYKDKEILILGGGDGALLYELRKENPKFVTMSEVVKRKVICTFYKKELTIFHLTRLTTLSCKFAKCICVQLVGTLWITTKDQTMK